jgi:hypothetical protein
MILGMLSNSGSVTEPRERLQIEPPDTAIGSNFCDFSRKKGVALFSGKNHSARPARLQLGIRRDAAVEFASETRRDLGQPVAAHSP